MYVCALYIYTHAPADLEYDPEKENCSNYVFMCGGIGIAYSCDDFKVTIAILCAVSVTVWLAQWIHNDIGS